jgi:hypothetical protein
MWVACRSDSAAASASRGLSRVNEDYCNRQRALLSRCPAFVARTWPPRAGKITLRPWTPWRSRESLMGSEVPSRGLHHRGDSHGLFQGGLRVIFRHPVRRAADTFRPACATARRAPSMRVRLAGRGETASEPCRAAQADTLPNARQRRPPSAAAKPENGARRLQRQRTDVRALAQLGRRGHPNAQRARVGGPGVAKRPASTRTASSASQCQRGKTLLISPEFAARSPDTAARQSRTQKKRRSRRDARGHSNTRSEECS